jgi:hypothetical protein
MRRRLCCAILVCALLIPAAGAAALSSSDIGKFDFGWHASQQVKSKLTPGSGALAAMRHEFRRAYANEQSFYSHNFQSGFAIGNPWQRVRTFERNFTVRFYQEFAGGTYGNAILAPPHAKPYSDTAAQWFSGPLYLVVGSFFEKWIAVGQFKTLGGPTANEHNAPGPWIVQNFEKGQIRFWSTKGTWWHLYGHKWHQ